MLFLAVLTPASTQGPLALVTTRLKKQLHKMRKSLLALVVEITRRDLDSVKKSLKKSRILNSLLRFVGNLW